MIFRLARAVLSGVAVVACLGVVILWAYLYGHPYQPPA